MRLRHLRRGHLAGDECERGEARNSFEKHTGGKHAVISGG
jgi:hypothetical protein